MIKYLRRVISFTFLFIISACGNSNDSPDSTQTSAVNEAPLAAITTQGDAVTGELFTLSAQNSNDPEGSSLSYIWQLTEQPYGSDINLMNSESIDVSFTPDIPGNYSFVLNVNDGELNSPAETIVINVKTGNLAPIAHAGEDTGIYTFQSAMLDGSASIDADDRIVSYEWNILSQPQNSNAIFSDAYSASTQFNTDNAGEYVIRLSVYDARGAEAHDDLVLMVYNPGEMKDIAGLTNDLEMAKEKWSIAGISNYTFSSSDFCYCATSDSTYSHIIANNEHITSFYQVLARHDHGSYELNIAETPNIFYIGSNMLAKNIDGLFDMVSQAIIEADELTVKYHDELGYPTNVSIDRDVQGFDDELAIAIFDFMNLDEINSQSCELYDIADKPMLSLDVIDAESGTTTNSGLHLTWYVNDNPEQSYQYDKLTTVDDFGVSLFELAMSDEEPVYFGNELGSYTIMVEKDGYQSKTVEVEVEQDSNCNFIPKQISVELEPTNT